MTTRTVPPKNTLYVNRWSDLPDQTEYANYRLVKGETVSVFSARKKTRQVLEGLLRQPVACASRCRISDRVLLLRRDTGLVIDMEMFSDPDISDSNGFGVYFLKSKVERIQPESELSNVQPAGTPPSSHRQDRTGAGTVKSDPGQDGKAVAA